MGGKSYKLYKTLKSCMWITTTITKVNQDSSKTKEKRKILSDNLDFLKKGGSVFILVFKGSFNPNTNF